MSEPKKDMPPVNLCRSCEEPLVASGGKLYCANQACGMCGQEQVANIQRNLAAKTMSCDRDTHRINNPIWEEEKP
jgi:hypothetical protein